MTIEGTWEEIATLSDKLQGQRVRVTVLPASSRAEIDEDEEDADDAPLTWEEWDKEREALREEFAQKWPKGVSAVELLFAERR